MCDGTAILNFHSYSKERSPSRTIPTTLQVYSCCTVLWKLMSLSFNAQYSRAAERSFNRMGRCAVHVLLHREQFLSYLLWNVSKLSTNRVLQAVPVLVMHQPWIKYHSHLCTYWTALYNSRKLLGLSIKSENRNVGWNVLSNRTNI